ncbi:MAG: glycosyltransferase family 2 protein [Chloroflexota bacterium]|nr:glycosyltransferase family 2 protein [Chloroflexota bacterium]
MENTLVSIVIPCYNQSQYLEECLTSLTDQNYTNWEAVVVDDASTEGDACAIVRSFTDERVRYMRHSTNRGLAAARNSGIKNSTGPLLLPLDADDKLDPRYLEKTVHALASQPDRHAAFADFLGFGAREQTINFRIKDVKEMLRGQWIPGPGTLMRRVLWEEVGGYCEAKELHSGNEDWDFWIGVAENGLNVAHLPEPLYCYRIHRESMSTRQRYTEYATRRFVYTRHRKLFDHYRMKHLFLGEGYRRSIEASWSRREWGRAVRLALEGAWLIPTAIAAPIRIARGSIKRR